MRMQNARDERAATRDAKSAHFIGVLGITRRAASEGAHAALRSLRHRRAEHL